MAIRYFSNSMGKISVRRRDGSKYNVDIRQGNCLAVMIYVSKNDDGTYTHTLWSFFADEAHVKNMVKGDCKLLGNDIAGVKLNLYYKECNTILKYLVRQGYKVSCYYKEPKKK